MKDRTTQHPRMWEAVTFSTLLSQRKLVGDAECLREGSDAMEHSHIFTVMSPNSTSWGPGGCPLGQLPVIYYSSLLCLGLPANPDGDHPFPAGCAATESSYNYLLALAVADIMVLLLIVFVDFLLEDFILGAPLPHSLNKAVQRSVLLVAGAVARAAGAGGSRRSSSAGQHVLVWIHCATVYLLPCSVFFSLNAIIVRKLRCKRSCFRLRGYSTGKTTAILLAITSVFAVLWAPRTLMILYHLYTAQPTMPGSARRLHLVTDVANMLALLNTGVNFFLYCFISRRFRRMAATVLKSLFRCRKQPPPFYASHTSPSPAARGSTSKFALHQDAGVTSTTKTANPSAYLLNAVKITPRLFLSRQARRRLAQP
ncbi:putative G-protein coupled receptor 139 G(q)-coupled orphan receptor GPRg1 [Triplophysa tibetana]|uniref:Putative G-protein coupled receptor 139 G(Q)-coupled orphan receptor GPRg1 n=1 Tax=Triplophysa tibetana TaxID=1572043 RepID=A0A5A9NA47_9TELE|nr:putative G-protein coupled receptor 139 G(q)-coupled orphan receptor GPRg1 [Triplophysa tibetana]